MGFSPSVQSQNLKMLEPAFKTDDPVLQIRMGNRDRDNESYCFIKHFVTPH